LSLALILALTGQALGVWWESGHDKWYVKDDWKGARVRQYAPTFNLRSPARSGWIVAWGKGGVTLNVKGQQVMNYVDGALIYDTDLTPYIKGKKNITLEFTRGNIVAEGEIIDDQARRYPFATGCDWPRPAGEDAQLPPAPDAYRPGSTRGTYHSAHNGLLMRYNDEETGKTEISKALARIQKLQDQLIFELRRHRLPAEILSFDPESMPKRVEDFALAQMKKAEDIIKSQAIPSQKNNKFEQAIQEARSVKPYLCAAELAVQSWTGIEKAKERLMHLKNIVLLMGENNAKVPVVKFDFTELENILDEAHREATFQDWGNVNKRAELANEKMDRIKGELTGLWGQSIDKPNRFSKDRFGWFNVLRLMDNGSENLQFSFLDPGANYIDLAGIWQFRLDAKNQGKSKGFQGTSANSAGWRPVRVPWPWEREGFNQINENHPFDAPYQIGDRRSFNKPYNGFAWYRTTVNIPRSWRDKEIKLDLTGVNNWCRLFVNGREIAARRDGGTFEIPTEAIRFGRENTIAVNVYNHSNLGGITKGPICLYTGANPLESLQTPGAMSFTDTYTLDAGSEEINYTFYSSSMSPAVVLSSDSKELRLWGWSAKGFAPPEQLWYISKDGAKKVELGDSSISLDGSKLGQSWLMLKAPVTDSSYEPANTRPIIIALTDRPTDITWGENDLGYKELTISFDNAGSKAALLGLSFDADTGIDQCSKWASRIRAVPFLCSEIARLDNDQLRGDFSLTYSYYELPGFSDDSIEKIASVPQLLSYAIKHDFPDIAIDRIETSDYRSSYTPYRFGPDETIVSYSTPLIDKTKLLKGAGELFAKRNPEQNSRGGVPEKQMFEDFKEWGFDHNRYAFHWGADWDLPLQEYMGGPINDDPQLWQRLDYLVDQHVNRGIMMMLCYFFNDDRPQQDSKGYVRNSTRYWKMHPEVKQNLLKFWTKIAKRYADYPEDLISYDFFNEPAYMTQDHWNQIIKDFTKAVRSVDKKHLIVIEAGDGWSQSEWFLWLEPTGDDNTIYSFHNYGKHWGYSYDEYYPGYESTPELWKDETLEPILFGIKNNVPMHCGEFGVSMISPGEDYRTWLNDYLALFERFGMGWNWWNWQGDNIYRTGLRAGDHISPNVLTLRKWISRKTGPQKK